MPEPPSFCEVVAAMPKAELHLHLEGAVPWAMVRQWSPASVPECPPWWDACHRFGSFGDFLAAMRTGWKGVLTTTERVAQAAAGLFAGLAAQNVRYVELSFGLGAYEAPVEETAAAIRSAAPVGLAVQVVGGISRDLDPAWMLDLASEALDAPSLNGIDLHGDEAAGGIERFADVFARARDRGMLAKAHAGESGGADGVRRTLEVLGVRRIEHGISAAGDPAVVRMLLDGDVTLEV